MNAQVKTPAATESIASPRRSRSWRGPLAALLAFCVGAGVALGLVSWLVGPAPPQLSDDIETVASTWTHMINELDIEPVFPPEEDIYVGDVFIIVTGGDPAEVGRMVKVWHVDMSADLEQAYMGMPFFEKVVDAQASATPKATQTDGAIIGRNTLFRSATPPHELSLVAFPGFTISHTRRAESGISNRVGILGLFSIARGNQDTVEFQLTSSATYGVPSIVATNRLAEFCTDAYTRLICTPEVARRELSMVVGHRAQDKRDGAYMLDVELILVGRVYLTRSITQRRASSNETGMQAKIAAQLQTLAQQTTLLAEAPTAAQSTPAASSSLVSPNATLQTIQKRILDLSHELSRGLPGGVASYTSADGSTVQLEQSFDRPLVIGYRAVRTILPYPEAK